MKKIYLIIVMAICSITSNAQISFGGQIGGNLGMGHAATDDPYYAAVTLANDPKPGFIIGVLAEISFSKLAFRPELNFIQKGSKNGYGSGSTKRTLNYVEVPLNVTYNMDLGPGKVFVGLGPAIAIGLSGKDKYSNGDKVDVKFDGKKLDDYNSTADAENNHLKRVDVGLNILAGYQLPLGVFAKIGYTHGFMNIDPDKDNAAASDRSTYKNRGISICVGYMIGGAGKKKK